MNTATQNGAEKLARDFVGFCTLTEGMQTLVVLLSPDGVILDLNRRMADTLGKAVNDLKGVAYCLP